MKLIYNLAILTIRILDWFASFVNVKDNLFVASLKNLLKEFKSALAKNTSPILWVHCTSLGEFSGLCLFLTILDTGRQSHLEYPM